MLTSHEILFFIYIYLIFFPKHFSNVQCNAKSALKRNNFEVFKYISDKP